MFSFDLMSFVEITHIRADFQRKINRMMKMETISFFRSFVRSYDHSLFQTFDHSIIYWKSPFISHCLTCKSTTSQFNDI